MVGAGRGAAAVDDVTAATDKLEASMGKGRLTAQTYNKTMDELFAIQRQIASDASLIDNFTASEVALRKATVAYQDAKNELIRLDAAVKAVPPIYGNCNRPKACSIAQVPILKGRPKRIRLSTRS